MGWSEKYKKSIDCNNPKGFSQKAHCAGRKKRKNEMVFEEITEDILNEKLITYGNRKPYGQVVFMAGGAGSGKGFAIKNFVDSASFKIRDVDEMKKQLQILNRLGKVDIRGILKKYGRNIKLKDLDLIRKIEKDGYRLQNLNLKNPDHVYALHILVKAMGIKDSSLTALLTGKNNPETLPNILFDITAKDVTDITSVIPKLKEVGYKADNIHLTWVLTSYVTAMYNNKKRSRMVPEDILLKTHEGAANTVWGLVTKALPKGMNGRVDVILNNPEHTVFYTDADGKTISGGVKGFLSLPLKKEKGGIFPEKVWKEKLFGWVKQNAPDSITANMEESVNEAAITYGIEYKSSKNDRKFKKASLTKTTHNPNIDKMMIKAISKDAKSLAKQDGWVDYRITKDGVPVKESVNEGKEPEVISQLRDIVKGKQNKKIKDPKSGKMMRVDLYSASAITKVYDAINKSNKDKFGKLSLPKMVNVAFSVIKKESVNERADYKYLTQVILDAKPKYNVYYNTSHNVVNIGGVGYDKGDLVKNFNQKPGSSSNIKANFFHANKDPQKTKREVEKLSNGKIKVTIGKGYGNEPIVYYSLKESIDESTLSQIHKAAKKGSYPVTIVATMLGKVVKQELVKTPMAVPAAVRMMQGGYPKAKISVEDSTGKILFQEAKLNHYRITGNSIEFYVKDKGKNLVLRFNDKRDFDKLKLDLDNPKDLQKILDKRPKKMSISMGESINEYLSPSDVDSAMKEFGIKKIPISSQGERILKGMQKEGFIKKVTNKERLIYFVESLGKEKFGYSTKGKPLSPLVSRYWNDISSEAIFFGGKMAAWNVVTNIKDRLANREEVDSTYYMLKDYFNSFGMDTNRSRVFKSAIFQVDEWLKRNKNIAQQIGENTMVNEISAIGGLKQVVKGNTKEVEGIKVSKEMAQAMIDWFNSSPYGRKYPKAKNARLHVSIGVMLAFGLDRYAKHKGAKEELKYLKSMKEAYKGNMSDFKYEFPNTFEDETGNSTKAIKKVSKKGKGYEVRTSTYMSEPEMKKVGDALGLKLVNYQKSGNVAITLYESVNEDKFYNTRVQYTDPKSKKKFVGDVVRKDGDEYKVNLGKDGRFEKYILAKEKDLKIVSKSTKRTFESVNEAFKPSQVRSAISRVKKQLMRKWKQKGGYENFGQKELSQMRDKFDYNPYGSSDEREIAKMLDGFDNWAMNYDGNMREAYVVLYAPKKGVPVETTAAYKDKKDAEKWAKSLGGITMIVKKKVKGIDEKIEERVNLFFEENCPTNPSKWSYYKGQAKKKFDVYPSAYANGWAAKQYKAAGGGWKKCK